MARIKREEKNYWKKVYNNNKIIINVLCHLVKLFMEQNVSYIPATWMTGPLTVRGDADERGGRAKYNV